MFNILCKLFDVSRIIGTSYYHENMWMYIDKDGRLLRLDDHYIQ